MPYHCEKGVVNLLLEQQFNQGREKLVRLLGILRDGRNGTNWVLGVLPEFERMNLGVRHSNGLEQLTHFCEHWLGMDVGGPAGTWARREQTAGRTGWWIGYTGDVDVIVRETLIWAFELALGLEPDQAITSAGPPPHRIELFNICTFPWFEGWVLRRPVSTDVADDDGPALVTVCWLTPAHVGSGVADSPVAHEQSAASNAFTHAVPSFDEDYQLLGSAHPLAPDLPRASPGERRWATWVVTHRTHRPSTAHPPIDDSTAPSPFGSWSMPRAVTYEGVDDVVVVAPSLAAGGVPWDGQYPLSEAGA